MVPIYYAPDEPVLIGTRIPPRANHEAPDNPEEPPATPNDTSTDEDAGEDDFQSAHSSDNDSDPDSPPDNNNPGPDGENAPEPDPPTQEDPGSNPGEGTSEEYPAVTQKYCTSLIFTLKRFWVLKVIICLFFLLF